MERHPEWAFLSKIDVFEDYENKGLLLQIVSLSFKKKNCFFICSFSPVSNVNLLYLIFFFRNFDKCWVEFWMLYSFFFLILRSNPNSKILTI